MIVRIAILLGLFGAFLIPQSEAQNAPYRDLLLFGQPWIDPTDYVWSRESFSKLASDSKPGARIRDVGRLRVRFIDLEEETLGLDVHVLNFRYETEIRGRGPSGGVSELEGVRLPRLWLHAALGFSVDSEPGSGFQSNIQAGEIFEVLDFRGFVPKEPPAVGSQWSARTERKPDDLYRFREERDRTFVCKSKETVDKGEKYEIQFTELLKVTAMAAGRTHEIKETTGTYWVILPSGMIETAQWESVSTETSSGRRGNSGSDKIETRTTVNVARRDAPPPKPRQGAEKGKAAPTEPPLPPR